MAFLDSLRITRTGIVFIVGAIVLVGLVIGTIFIVRDRGEQARRQDAIEVAQKNLEEQSQTSTPAAEGDSEKAPTTNTAVPEAETPAQTSSSSTTQSSTQLPETGADLTTLIIVSLLALSVSYYVASRRAVRGL